MYILEAFFLLPSTSRKRCVRHCTMQAKLHVPFNLGDMKDVRSDFGHALGSLYEALLTQCSTQGYGTLSTIIAGQILSAVSGGSMTIIVGIVVVALIGWVVAVFGMKVFHTYERYADACEAFPGNSINTTLQIRRHTSNHRPPNPLWCRCQIFQYQQSFRHSRRCYQRLDNSQSLIVLLFVTVGAPFLGWRRK